MSTKVGSLIFTSGQYLTRAGNQLGPLFSGHFYCQKNPATASSTLSNITAFNQANQADASAAGSVFFLPIPPSPILDGVITQLQFYFAKSWTGAVNYAVEVSVDDSGTYVSLGSGTISSGTTSGNVSVSGSVPIATGGFYTVIRLIIWGADTSARTFTLSASTNVSYSYSTLENSEYPYALDTYRNVENRPGVVYNPAQATSVFADDMLQRSDAIRGIEGVVGLNPQYHQLTVRDYLRTLMNTNGATYGMGISANAGSALSVTNFHRSSRGDGYFISGLFRFTANNTGFLYIDISQWNLDLRATTFNFRFRNTVSGTWYDGVGEVNAQTRTLRLTYVTGLTNPIFETNLNVFLPRQMEGWLTNDFNVIEAFNGEY